MSRRRTQICANKNRIGAISTIPPENINQIVLLEYLASADDAQIKYFYRRQPPACLQNELTSTSEVSRRSMPGTDYDSAINVHPFIELHVSAALFCFVFFPVHRIMPNFALGK